MAKVSLEGKTKLPLKVQDSILDCASSLSQIVKGSRSSDNLTAAARNFGLQEAAVENSDANLKRMHNLVSHLKVQADAAQTSIQVMSEVQDRLSLLEKTQYWNKQTESNRETTDTT